MSDHLDAAALRALHSQLGGDHALQQRFVGDFLALWTVRTERLERALEQTNLDDADVVLLSIRSSSLMVGAVRLAAVAALIRSALRRGDVPGCRLYLAHLHTLGDDACDELRAYFTL